MYSAIQRFLKDKGTYFVKVVKILYHNHIPPISAPANIGQELQVPLRPLSRGYTVLAFSNP